MMNKKPICWDVKITALPRDENELRNYTFEAVVCTGARQYAITKARKKLMKKYSLTNKEYRTRVISCNEV